MAFNSIKVNNGTIKVLIIDSSQSNKKKLDGIYSSYESAIVDMKKVNSINGIIPTILLNDYLIIQTNNDKIVPFLLTKLKEEGIII